MYCTLNLWHLMDEVEKCLRAKQEEEKKKELKGSRKKVTRSVK